jgi:uncharacterized protein DUF4389
MSSPVTIEFEREYAVNRWAALINWILAIPHFLVLYGLTIVSRAITVISLFTVLFTKDIPEGLFNFQVMVQRYQLRVSTYALFMKSEYPPFEFPMVPADPGGDAARFTVVKPAEYQRWMPLVKWLLAIPHYFVLIFLYIGAVFAILVAFFAVLFTAQWPQGLRDYVIGVTRWQMRVTAYAFNLLVDEYPPFSVE